jgi:hypothetical protein
LPLLIKEEEDGRRERERSGALAAHFRRDLSKSRRLSILLPTPASPIEQLDSGLFSYFSFLHSRPVYYGGAVVYFICVICALM